MPEKRVLLVDDDSMCLHFMKELLEDKYVLKVAQNGQEAIEIAGEFKPDLVVLDNTMPGADGFEICQSLRNIGPSEEIKFVFVSVKELNSARQNDVNTNGYGFLLKPFVSDHFNHQIEIMLEA